ncbi:hypothetical protein RD110_15665 [Rhodoferax koreense]|uniref:Uncharacterized protein n=1 Tax=Rhodoferax koreensis TaxID=1842727 RepID=A0A1P8JXH7_9BURK|nr:hypothetical protein [Rhodoferax koreense]APW38460.1 hypothetical protein RD110_15665 [Rhodoferax koreense]
MIPLFAWLQSKLQVLLVLLFVFPLIVRHCLGRAYVFRDAPLWVVEAVAKQPLHEDADFDEFIKDAQEELVLRQRRRRLEVDR